MHYLKNIKLFVYILAGNLLSLNAAAQVVLEADGPGNTYELINSVFAPGYDVTETPDCAHPDFGRHIDEVMDPDLGIYVFRFHIHVTPDNDRCINFDRQRNEIKSYDKSPANLKAVEGETVEYSWKFKLDSAFQPSTSFTHIHQLKAVGGSEESMPLITLTPRKSSTNSLQLRYAKNTSQTTIKQVALAPFLGNWVEVKEKVLYGEQGSYELQIKRVSDGEILLDYSNKSIRMWKTGASFIRPKWGIYRSLDVPSDLRDEVVLFASFSVREGIPTSVKQVNIRENKALKTYPNPASESVSFEYVLRESDHVTLGIYSLNGKLLKSIVNQKQAGGNYIERVDVTDLSAGTYLVKISSGNLNMSEPFIIHKGYN
ncbi:T9SS type A sorting domain-containing protein [Mariniphaga sediminis]|uniref:T9SS type A sorting domain-containing protein n=1 Tax=Mariniphaga sediminis TaxID=1628158 RepID=UPI00356345CB